MKPGLIEDIQSHGYWRVNFQPKSKRHELLQFLEMERIVSQSRVEMRGWDYPHFSKQVDEDTGFERHADYLENWTTWQHHVEFWRLYRSSQFLSYRALWVDRERNVHANHRPAGNLLSTQGALWSIVEILEFLKRMRMRGLYEAGAVVRVSLNNARDRKLWVSSPRRMPFTRDKVSFQDKIDVSLNISGGDLLALDSSYPAKMAVELFSFFEWDPPFETIKQDVERYLRGDLG